MPGRKLKKNVKGPSAQYITRARALKNTQLRLAEFRRLCILKGIYPREPKRKFKGPDATYYHMKDIQLLSRDPIMAKFRAEKAYDKKIKKAVGRKEIALARRLTMNKPNHTLHHIVKERYPTLLDAVRDLDDPLSTLALFASLPCDDKQGITKQALLSSMRLIDEFHFLVSHGGMLRKAFASIKGFYFQAEILGHPVTWLVPHQYTQDLPFEVDFRVMLTFLDFYSFVAKFSNFKLYNLRGLEYPPPVDQRMRKTGCRHLALSAVELAKGEESTNEVELSACGNEVETKTDVEEVTAGGGQEGQAMPREQPKIQEANTAGVFKGLVFFISREVPLAPLSFILRSGGASFGWDNESSPLEMESPTITHHIVDRSVEQLESLFETWNYLPPRTFIQPQWALDCLNNDFVIPAEPYRPGVRPPPHLSPFVDDAKLGYIPKQRDVINSFLLEKNQTNKKSEKHEQENDTSDIEGDDDGDDEDAQIANLALAEQYQQEIDKERQGQWFSHSFVSATGVTEMSGNQAKGNSSRIEIAKNLFEEKTILGGSKEARRKKKEKEELERRVAMMSNRKRRLKETIQAVDDTKKKKADRLRKKRVQAELEVKSG